MSLADARAAARKLLGQVAAGADPAEAKTDAKHEATLQNLVDAYMQRHAEPHKRTAWQDRKVLGRYLPSTWYTRRLSTITRDEVVELHARVGRDHGHYAANRLLALLRTMLNLARDWNLLKGDNPAIRIKLFKEEKRERFLSPEEVRRLKRRPAGRAQPLLEGIFSACPYVGDPPRGTAFGPRVECRLGSPHATTARDQGRSVSSTAPTRTSYRATTIASQPRAGRICVPGPRCLRPLG